MTAGARNKFYAYCSIGQQTQDLKYQGEPTYLEIGDENSFREFVTVNRSTTSAGKTRIGNCGNFLAYSHIGHDCVVGDAVVFSNNGTLAGHVQVGDNAVMGGLTAVHQFCRLGRYGLPRLFKNRGRLRFMIADGNPAKCAAYLSVWNERIPPERSGTGSVSLALSSKYNTRHSLEAIRRIALDPEITDVVYRTA